MSNKLKSRKNKSSLNLKSVNPETAFITNFIDMPITATHPSALKKPYDIHVHKMLMDLSQGKMFPLCTKTFSLTSTEILKDYPNSVMSKIASKFLETKKLSLSQSGRDILNSGEADIPFIDFSITQKMTREEFRAFADELQNIVSAVLGVGVEHSEIAKKPFRKDTYDYFFDDSQYCLGCTYYWSANDTTTNCISLMYIKNEQF